MRVSVLGFLVVTTLGCGGVFVNRGGLRQVREALIAVDVPYVAPLFAVGAVEAGLVRFSCGEAITAAANADPRAAEVLLRAALADPAPTCPRACGDVDPAAIGDDRDAIREVVRACDNAGPDPQFGGPLAPLRTAMTPGGYLVFRHLLAHAEAQDGAWGEQRGPVAVSLALAGGSVLTPTDVVAIEGSLTPSSSAFTTQADALRACSVPHLQHRVVVAPGGGVAGVRGPPDGDCVANLLRAMTFPSSQGWGWFDVTWTVPPGGAPQ